MIGNTPSYPQPPRGSSVANNVIVPIGGEDDYKQSLARKPTYIQRDQVDDSRVAGVKFRPRTGERSMDEVFATNGTGQSPYVGKIESRSLQAYDITGADPARNYNVNIAAGVKTGSPKRKNESSVFSHLPNE